jgi:hypothetical protein
MQPKNPKLASINVPRNKSILILHYMHKVLFEYFSEKRLLVFRNGLDHVFTILSKVEEASAFPTGTQLC